MSAALYRRLPRCARCTRRATSVPLGPSRGIVYKLAALFSLDAFAGGFVVQSLLALWLFERFDLSLTAASLFFFWSSTLERVLLSGRGAGCRAVSASSTPWCSRTSRRASCLILAAFSPNLIVALGAAAGALRAVADGCADAHLLRHGGRDAARSAPPPRALPRCRAASPRAISPALAGVLLATPFTGLPLVICGVLKIVYDLALLFSFRHIKPPEEQIGVASRSGELNGGRVPIEKA